MSANSITIVGNMTREAELRFTNNGKAVANFGVAVNRWRGPDQEEAVSFFEVTVWETLAEHMALVPKGTRVIVSGRMDMEEWEDKDTGAKRTKLVLVADEAGPSLRWATAEITRMAKGDSPTATTVKATINDEEF